MISPVSLRILEYYPAPNHTGTSNNFQGQAVEHGQRRPGADARRSEPRQQDPPERPLQLARQLHENAQRAPVAGIDQPRVNKNWLVSYTHTLKANLHNDFRIGYHRMDFDTLNRSRTASRCRRGARHSRVRRRRQLQQPGASRASTSATSPGSAVAARTGIQFDRRSRCRT